MLSATTITQTSDKGESRIASCSEGQGTVGGGDMVDYFTTLDTLKADADCDENTVREDGNLSSAISSAVGFGGRASKFKV